MKSKPYDNVEYLFCSYLDLTRKKVLCEKTKKDYISALSGRIKLYAQNYVSEFETIFSMPYDEAEELLECLLKDDEFIKHCEGSHKVQITAIKHYLKFIKSENKSPKEGNKNVRDDSETTAKEGSPYKCHLYEYRRNRALRNQVAQENDYVCYVCGLKFETIYGSIGEEFIEVHHKHPIHDGERETKPEDLVCVCSNCHSMLHRNASPLSPEELKKIIESNK